MRPDYIFISGVNRTGSTLLVRILNKSSEIAITNRENWFLGHQIPAEGIRHIIRRNIGDLSDEANVYKLVDFLYTAEFKRSNLGYWAWLRKCTDPDLFLRKILNAPERSERVVFALMMEIQGRWLQERKGLVCDSPVLGEKTPSHIYYVPTLLEWFPNSKVIHTFRDPRGVFASEFRRRDNHAVTFPYRQLNHLGPVFQMYILLQVTYMWLRAAKLHLEYQRDYPDRYYLYKFEESVCSPKRSLHKLCNFLGVEFQEQMLEQKVVSRGFKLGQSGFDKRAADRWKDLNPSWVNRWFQVVAGNKLRELGYVD